jgi:hypothetical protein
VSVRAEAAKSKSPAKRWLMAGALAALALLFASFSQPPAPSAPPAPGSMTKTNAVQAPAQAAAPAVPQPVPAAALEPAVPRREPSPQQRYPDLESAVAQASANSKDPQAVARARLVDSAGQPVSMLEAIRRTQRASEPGLQQDPFSRH